MARNTLVDESNREQGVAVSVPIGVVATGVLLAAGAAIAYVLLAKESNGVVSEAGQAARSGKGMLRKAGLMTLITMIENDATRKVVVAILRAMARRA
jgi:hypothetical protein